jgi:ABC-type glycerol-3-phosphate transport system permease component
MLPVSSQPRFGPSASGVGRIRPGRVWIHALIILGAVGMVFPFFWMVSTSLKTQNEAIQFPPQLIPAQLHFSNYLQAWEEVPFPRYFLNTILITVVTLVGVLATSCLAAYAFANLKFRGRDTIFLIFISTMIVPQPVYLVPSYIILAKLGWIDTYLALTVPWMASVFSIFLLRQHFKTIPRDLYDAATIDGCSHLGFLMRVVIPLSRAVLVTVGLFDIIASWNSFIWPLVVTHRDSMRPIQVGLSYFAQEQGAQWPLLMAAATFCTLPVLIIYFFAQRQIIESFARSGLKE